MTTFPPQVDIKTGTARQSKELLWRGIYLVLAGVFEIVWATAMKQSLGFSRLWPSVITIAAMIVSFALLSAAMRSFRWVLPIRSGQALALLEHFVIGILIFGETLSPMRVGAAVLIVSGLVMMKLSTP